MSRAFEPDIALAFSADPWVELLHRYCTDHGGARVCQLVMDPVLAVEESFDAFVVSHRWPSLSAGLVAALRARGRVVIGVHDGEDAGRALLESVGVDALLGADCPPEEMVASVRDLVAERPAPRPSGASAAADAEASLAPLVVVGGPAGSGATEVAIALAQAFATRRARTALIDTDLYGASVAARLSLPLEPNLATAIDAVEHGFGTLPSAIGRAGSPAFSVITGVPGRHTGTEFRASEVGRVLDAMQAEHAVVVVDVGATITPPEGFVTDLGAMTPARALVAGADAVVVVGHATPTGMVAASGWTADAQRLAPSVPRHIVLNRVPKDRFRRRDCFAEASGWGPVASVTLLAHDTHVVDAAWAGCVVRRGAWRRGVEQLARAMASDARPLRRTPARRHAGTAR